MQTTGHDIIVIGASAGGPEALAQLLIQLPSQLPASVFIVNHIAPETPASVLLNRLTKASSLPCGFPQNDDPIIPGRVYVAPPDHHLLIKDDRVLITRGPHENHSRPAIDPLFRSAAVSYGSRVIGVILTGLLDDGTAGLVAVKRCGGLVVIQDPNEAAFPEMPQSALRHVSSDHCVPVEQMGPLLERLVNLPANGNLPIPPDLILEAEIAQRALSDINKVEQLGEWAPYSCPDCNGALWEIKHDNLHRFRCQVGHSFSAEILFRHHSQAIEETLWVALRLLEERHYMLARLAEQERKQGMVHLANAHAERSREAQLHIDRIREILLSGNTGFEAENREEVA